MPAARGGEGSQDPGRDHSLDCHVQCFPETWQGQCGRRVAGHHNDLGPLAHKHACDFLAVALDRLPGLASVGHARRVAEIKDILPGQLAPQGADHGETTDARIENGDGGATHAGSGQLEARTRAQNLRCWSCWLPSTSKASGRLTCGASFSVTMSRKPTPTSPLVEFPKVARLSVTRKPAESSQELRSR